MSGKSTYIRSIALVQIMAQIGCFVPAEYAVFPIIEQLFVRTSTDDSIETNMSTFSREMREMAFILRNITENSLVIVDELGRGTSTRDGLAIALAISEALIQSNAFVWFATHFHELGKSCSETCRGIATDHGITAKILGKRPGVLNLHLATGLSRTGEHEVPRMTMLYKVDSGPAEENNYGIQLAEVIGFPPEFVRTAEDVSTALRTRLDKSKKKSTSSKVALRRKLILNLYDTLELLHGSSMGDAALGNYLKKLQNEFVVRMSGIENGQQLADAASEASIDLEEADVL
jgi:DNA mismatch repair protein MSH4